MRIKTSTVKAEITSVRAKMSKIFASVIVAAIVFSGVNANDWSACSKSCGGGSQTMSYCLFGSACSTIYRGCNRHPCISGWGEWQPCSVTCGGGSRFKVDKCSMNDINKCPKRYGDCNTQSCKPLANCPIDHDFRYSDRSSCCRRAKAEICGVVDTQKKQRVFGGKKAELGMWPWAAVMVKKATDTTHCGGNLIHKKWVLTAAHCLSGYKKEDHHILLGTISIKFPAAASQKKELEDFVIHANYQYPLNDIGLVKLKTEAVSNSVIKPACLPSGEIVQQDTNCIAAGWGITSPQNQVSGTASDVLMQVSLRVLPLDSCREGLKRVGAWEWEHIDSAQHLCIGKFAGGSDTCTGDSGGPIVCQRCSSCNWYLAAITSFGPADCAAVAAPGVYINIRKYELWIRQHIALADNNYFSC